MTRKDFSKLRYGLRDHLPIFARNPEAATIYILFCHMEAPFRGPRAGKVMIPQKELADEMGWSRHRVGRAVRWLCRNPSRQKPYLIQVTEAKKGQSAEYYIRNFDGEEKEKAGGDSNGNGVRQRTAKSGNGGTPTHPNRENDVRQRTAKSGNDGTPAHPNGQEWRAPDGTLAHSNNLYRRARGDQRGIDQRRGAPQSDSEEDGERQDPVSESGELTIVASEEDAKKHLIRTGHIGRISDPKIREMALKLAMKNLHAYGVAIDPDMSSSRGEDVGTPDTDVGQGQVEGEETDGTADSQPSGSHESPRPGPQLGGHE